MASGPRIAETIWYCRGRSGRHSGLLNYGLMPFTGPRVPGFVFLLAVVVLALFLGRGPVLFAGAASALVWDYYFLPPRFTFIITTAEDAILFARLYFRCWPSCSASSSRVSARRNWRNGGARNAPWRYTS